MNCSNAPVAEKELIEKAKVDKEAFMQIYDSYFRKIYNYAYYRTMDQSEAEEITSQTFLLALESIGKFEYRGVPLGVWLYRIASNVLVDLFRKKNKTLVLDDNEFEAAIEGQPETILVSKDEKSELAQLLKKLPPPQQQAVILRYIQELSYKEISEIMDKSEGAVKQLLHRGLTTLRERMVRYE